jgi:alkylated DNA nucleotide flippase Atl1
MSALQPTVEELRTIIADDTIAQWKADFASLDASTSEGYSDVKDAIGICRKTRTSIEATRKSLNENALRWQRTVNAEAKRITALIEEVEEPLKAKKQAVDDEVERKRKELEEKRRSVIQGRASSRASQAAGGPGRARPTAGGNPATESRD